MLKSICRIFQMDQLTSLPLKQNHFSTCARYKCAPTPIKIFRKLKIIARDWIKQPVSKHLRQKLISYA